MKRNGRGFWCPHAKQRAAGFEHTPCGFDGPAAWAIAEDMNRRWRASERDDYANVITVGDLPPSEIKDDGSIYVIGLSFDWPVKIGFSTSPQERLVSLQTGHHQRLAIIAQTSGAADDERKLHKLFHHDRLNGEWFKRSTEIEKFIALIGRRGLPIHLAVKWITDDRKRPIADDVVRP